MKFTLRLVIAGATLVAGVGCGASSSSTTASSSSSSSSETTGTKSSPIIAGSVDTDVHDAVVLIAIVKNGQADSACTGTMVAPNLVLTARHCVSETEPGGAACLTNGTPFQGGGIKFNFAPTDLLIYTGLNAVDGIDDPQRSAAHGQEIIVEDTNTYCDRDVAFILLDRPLNATVAPIRLKGGARSSEQLTAVGWGITDNGEMPTRRMQRGGVQVTTVGPAVLDQPTGVGVSGSEFLVGEAFCSGDSGGPSFSSTGAVVGVVSRGGNPDADPNNTNPAAGCMGNQTRGFYTHLANKLPLVNKAFASSGYTPRDEGAGPGKLVGAACASHLQCSSEACIEGSCVARCDGAGKCGGANQACTAKSDIKVCVTPTASKADPSAESTTEEEEESDDSEATSRKSRRKPVVASQGCSASSAFTTTTNASSPTLFLLLTAVTALGAKRRLRTRRSLAARVSED